MSETSANFITLTDVARDRELHQMLGLKSEGTDALTGSEKQLIKQFSGKRILVTGGGGSIGSELVARLCAYNPKSIAILDINENNSYLLYTGLLKERESIDINIYIGSVRDKDRVEEVFSKEKPQVVFHTAAHKHLPLMQTSPKEAIKNNLFGTKVIIDACEKHQVQAFLLVSTDKAVNPTCVMGKSKRACEMLMQSMAKNSSVTMCAVRFGNVFASEGSVVPILLNQLKNGKPLTLTSPDMVRYFMTITRACDLLLLSVCHAQKGHIYLLDMGTPIKLTDLANAIIKRYAKGESIITYIGKREGEKSDEQLVFNSEKTQNLTKEILKVSPMPFNKRTFKSLLSLLQKQLKSSDEALALCTLDKIIKLCKN